MSGPEASASSPQASLEAADYLRVVVEGLLRESPDLVFQDTIVDKELSTLALVDSRAPVVEGEKPDTGFMGGYHYAYKVMGRFGDLETSGILIANPRISIPGGGYFGREQTNRNYFAVEDADEVQVRETYARQTIRRAVIDATVEIPIILSSDDEKNVLREFKKDTMKVSDATPIRPASNLINPKTGQNANNTYVLSPQLRTIAYSLFEA